MSTSTPTNALTRQLRSPLLLLGALLAALWCVSTTVPVHGQADQKTPKMLRHVVLFQFKDSSSQAEVQAVVDAFRALPSKISQVADFEYGTNNSPEGLDGGLTHCFLVSFQSAADRDAYLPHPAHLEFVELLKPHLEKATVVDYWAQH